jgi:peptidoglycan hydrolase CwlO-like protein
VAKVAPSTIPNLLLLIALLADTIALLVDAMSTTSGFRLRIMSQTPITVTYSLEEVLSQINQKLDKLQEDVTEIKIGQVKLEGKLETLETELKGEIKVLEMEIKGEIKVLEIEIKGIGKRLDTQEFINRSVVVGFVLAICAGAVKLFFPNFPN